MSVAPRVEATSDGRASRLLVRAQPGAKRSGLAGLWNDHLKVAVRSPADAGRANEELLEVLAEELGVRLEGPLAPLGAVRQAGGKWVTAYATERDLDPADVRSNDFEMEWPPRSGRLQRFPEVSAARWHTFEQARTVMLPSQQPLLDRLAELIG